MQITEEEKIRYILSHEKEIEEEYKRQSANDFLLFADGLYIPSATGPQLFKNCMAPFQQKCFKALEPSLMSLKIGTAPAARRFWIERTKKASKDGDLGVVVLWLLAFSRRPFLIQICASDQDQAAIIKRRVESIIYYNSWLNDLVRVRQNKIKGVNDLVELVIEATDTAGGSHGETPDLLILNELVHVKKWGVMETHMNNADGVPRGVVIVSTNAGIKGTKAEVWRKNAFGNQKRWTIHTFDGIAPWIQPEDVEDARKRDPIGAEFARLWKGRWISGRGGAVEDTAIDKCFKLEGPIVNAQIGWEYVAGLDLGVSHDHSGIAVIGVNKKLARVVVPWIKGFEPTLPNDRGVKEVDIAAVKAECIRIFKIYNVGWFGYDPAAGGSFLAQELRKIGLPMREMTFSSNTNCTQMAQAFVLVVKDGKLECYEDQEGRLRRDFGKFSIEPKVPGGYKLIAVSDEYGHADVGTALIIALPRAIETLGGWGIFGQEDSLVWDDDKDLSDEEIEQMPDDLRDIYSMGDSVGFKKPLPTISGYDPFADIY